jgi:hypothetical protein
MEKVSRKAVVEDVRKRRYVIDWTLSLRLAYR